MLSLDRLHALTFAVFACFAFDLNGAQWTVPRGPLEGCAGGTKRSPTPRIPERVESGRAKLMKHWYRTSPSSVISAPPCGEVKVTRTRVPSGNGSRVSTNIPLSVMLRPTPAATPRSPSRKTGNALSNLPTAGGFALAGAEESFSGRLGTAATVGAGARTVKETAKARAHYRFYETMIIN
jgi:hypothetical protein